MQNGQLQLARNRKVGRWHRRSTALISISMPARSCLSPPTFLLLAGLLTGCGSAPSVRYLVAISPSDPRSVLVTAEWAGVPQDSLVLTGFESTDNLRIS